MEIKDLQDIEDATKAGRRETFRIGMALLFIVVIMLYVATRDSVSVELVAAAMIGGYMAMNIGANDVANNVGPTVGSKALTMSGAIGIAVVFEAAGALIAGGDVVSTIKKGIIDPAMIDDTDVFIWLMMAALLAGAIWLNIATAVGAPVSTTHSIVGGVLGAGIAAGGWGIANWGNMAQIAASWVISPMLGGIIAASFLYWIKHTITYRSDMLTAAKKWVPLMVSVMAMAFGAYIALKGIKKLIKLDLPAALAIGVVAAIATYFFVRPLTAKFAEGKENSKATVNGMFTLPLICAAALLSFAHGANDVANAVGPLAAITEAVNQGEVTAKAHIPIWVMLIGAIGISIGLALFGPKLIRTVGTEITELDQMRAFCIAMAAAITVIVASQLGLPVSSTHIAVGGVFGVGFLREYIKANYGKVIDEIHDHHAGHEDQQAVDAYLESFHAANLDQQRLMLKKLKVTKGSNALISKAERKSLRKEYKQQLVKRSALIKIATAWVITVPLSALLAALLFFTIRGMMLP